MKASELNGHHLGQRVTISEGGRSITGELSRVDHQGRVLIDNPIMAPEMEMLGRLWVTLEFLGGFTANVTQHAVVAIHE